MKNKKGKKLYLNFFPLKIVFVIFEFLLFLKYKVLTCWKN